MAEDNFTLTTFYTSWKAYQDHIKEALAPLTAEQLALRAAPHLRSIGENAVHIIGCRAGWFTFLGEDSGADVKAMRAGTSRTRPPEQPPSWCRPSTAPGSLWPIAWPAGVPPICNRPSPDDWDGKQAYLSRAWVVWHVLEHDLHHGGELSLTLGMHGLPADSPVEATSNSS